MHIRYVRPLQRDEEAINAVGHKHVREGTKEDIHLHSATYLVRKGKRKELQTTSSCRVIITNMLVIDDQKSQPETCVLFSTSSCIEKRERILN